MRSNTVDYNSCLSLHHTFVLCFCSVHQLHFFLFNFNEPTFASPPLLRLLPFCLSASPHSPDDLLRVSCTFSQRCLCFFLNHAETHRLVWWRNTTFAHTYCARFGYRSEVSDTPAVRRSLTDRFRRTDKFQRSSLRDVLFHKTLSCLKKSPHG